ncbi:MAG: amidohydrolase family protein [Bdellovibrionales bacterium]
MAVLLRGGRVVTMNSKRHVFTGDVRVDGRHIVALGTKIDAQKGDTILDVQDHFVIPGLIQVHTHLCQAMFRGFADDLRLLDWLKKKIWPMESGHNGESLTASAQIGLLEMQLLGTTSILDMGTVQHTDHIFKAVQESGMRYVGGNCLMDRKGSAGPLWQARQPALKECQRLIEKWQGQNPLIEYALNPRFAISCSDHLLRDCVGLQKSYNLKIHTHASESLEEIAIVKARTGLSNVDYLDSLGMLGPQTVLVHGVHLSAGELRKMIRTKTPLVHCPSSNLKLASGIAPIERYRKLGLQMGLGSDGAPCNNNMDPFLEMRLTALLQKPRFGPEAMSAAQAFELATLGGARVLGKSDLLGSLEAGKLADIAVVEASHPSVATVENPYSALVYSCSGRDVRHVLIDGQIVVRDRQHWRWSLPQVVAKTKDERKKLFSRIGISA